ncbi:hypothetical protein [Streptomyces sp. AC627_RSS907]|uniref:hypothetical protein n=1 Tax=Streptomyces sp. AC627_RSS907 TaxID=2823684 RepID=UPI001C2797E8|nr:hypothetical protein [Streptomyces sp. AC627_RSS907]
MGAGYTADVDRIRDRSKNIAEAVELCHALIPRFERASAAHAGWWGTEGEGDDFADQVGPQIREEEEKIKEALASITNAFTGLVDAVFAEAEQTRLPQMDALDSIQQATASGNGAKH